MTIISNLCHWSVLAICKIMWALISIKANLEPTAHSCTLCIVSLWLRAVDPAMSFWTILKLNRKALAGANKSS